MTDLITRAREALEHATPGKWRVGERSNLTHAIRDCRNQIIAETKHRGLIGGPERRANANLIALSPDLARLALAAEELAEAVDAHIQHHLDTDQPMPRKMEAALASFNAIAKGEQS